MLITMKNIIKYIAVLTATVTLISCGDDQNAQQAQAGAQRTMPFPVFEVPTQTVTGYTTYPTSIEGIVNSELELKSPVILPTF